MLSLNVVIHRISIGKKTHIFLKVNKKSKKTSQHFRFFGIALALLEWIVSLSLSPLFHRNRLSLYEYMCWNFQLTVACGFLPSPRGYDPPEHVLLVAKHCRDV